MIIFQIAKKRNVNVAINASAHQVARAKLKAHVDPKRSKSNEST